MGQEPIRVMSVDDSAIVRGMIARALEASPDIRVVTTADNGQSALTQLDRHAVDIIVLDIEMPVMDGITALPLLLAKAPNAKIIMASTLTVRNAEISLKALSLGASDYVSKPTARGDGAALENFYRELTDKVRALAPKSRGASVPASPPVVAAPPAPVIVTARASSQHPEALAIGSSTGGPQALMTLFAALKGRLPPVPVFVTQHMPPTFTTLLAQRIAEVAGWPCAEARDGEAVEPGRIYLAPGDYHMIVRREGGSVRLHIHQGPQENFCRPAVDPMLRSLAEVYGGRLLTTILTGMGQDGLLGGREVTAAGGTIIAQDEATSVVWGMPGAVAKEGICAAVLPLPEIAPHLVRAFGGG